MKRPILLIAFAMGIALFGTLHAQVTIGSNAAPDDNSILDLKNETNPSASTKGLLLPRVALTSPVNASPLTAHVAGMVVYNTTANTTITPGYYYNDGSKWVRIADSATEPWYNVATNTGATTNTQNIYQTGKTGIGLNTTPARLTVYENLVNPTNGVSLVSFNSTDSTAVANNGQTFSSNFIGSGTLGTKRGTYSGQAVYGSGLISNLEAVNSDSYIGSFKYNVDGTITSGKTYSGKITNFQGVKASATVGSGTVENLNGVTSSVGRSGTSTGIVANARAFYVQAAKTGGTDAGKTHTATGLEIPGASGYPSISATGATAANYAYGIKINQYALAASNATTNKTYAIGVDATDDSYFMGRVGMGTNAPTAPLHVLNPSKVESNNTFYTTLITDTLAKTPTTLNMPALFARSYTSASDNNAHAYLTAGSFSSYNYGTGALTAQRALQGGANHYGSRTVTLMDGGLLIAANRSTGIITTQNALSAQALNYSSGTVEASRGLHLIAGNTNTATGTVTNAVGVHSSIVNDGIGSTVINGYGVWIGIINATNRWALYAMDETAPSYLAGRVGIGTNTPGNALHVKATSNPLRLEGLQATTTTTDSVMMVDGTGVVKYKTATALTANTAWSLTGNAGTTPGTNFLGTTDEKDLMLKVNNIQSGYITHPNNLASGYARKSTAFGYSSLLNATTVQSTSNTAIGAHAMENYESGVVDKETLGGNTGIGSGALRYIKKAGYNTAIGYNALGGSALTTNSWNNTAIGSEALKGLISGTNNTAVGNSALIALTSGSANVSIGLSNSTFLTTGGANVVIGTDAGGASLTTGSGNILLGQGTTVPDNNGGYLNIGNIIKGTGASAGAYGTVTDTQKKVGIATTGMPVSTLEVNGTLGLSTATSGTSNTVVLMAGGTFNTPAASSNKGRVYIIRNTNASSGVTVDSIIDYGSVSSSNFTLTPAIGAIMIISDGTNWYRIN